MTRTLTVLAAVVALVAPVAAAAEPREQPASATLAVIGDTPYGPAQIANFPNDVSRINADRLLANRLRVEIGRGTTADRVLLDTFDARLRDGGLRAQWPARRTASRRLTVHEPGAPVRCVHVADAPGVGVAALPPGPLRDRLAPVLEERALLPVVRVRSRMLPIAVLDGDDKTVVRMLVERPAVVREHGSVPVAARLHVESVRGYERDFERTVRLLRDQLGFAEAAAPLFDAAVTAAGGRRPASRRRFASS